MPLCRVGGAGQAVASLHSTLSLLGQQPFLLTCPPPPVLKLTGKHFTTHWSLWLSMPCQDSSRTQTPFLKIGVNSEPPVSFPCIQCGVSSHGGFGRRDAREAGMTAEQTTGELVSHAHSAHIQT